MDLAPSKYNTSEQPLYPSLAQMPMIDILRLIRSENVGPITFFELIKRYGTAQKAIKALPMLALRGGAKRTIRVCSVDAAETELQKMQHFGAVFIPYGHAHYPRLLMQIPDAPPLLSVIGHSHLLAHYKPIAMVGSRNASANGCRFAKHLATELGEIGHVVISGLARGIDTYAHQGALSTGTVAVIAGGIDQIYPQENTELFSQIRDRGVIVTEAPFGSPPQHRHFPVRNRIIAGMSLGTIVVEATHKSGSLITAKYALDYHRDIFAVPGFPMDPRSAGTNQLIQEGAMLIRNAHDVADYLLNRPYEIRESSKPPMFSLQHSYYEDASDTLDAEREILLGMLGATPITIEELIVISGIEARLVNVLLLELELAGELERHIGGRVSRIFTDEVYSSSE